MQDNVFQVESLRTENREVYCQMNKVKRFREKKARQQEDKLLDLEKQNGTLGEMVGIGQNEANRLCEQNVRRTYMSNHTCVMRK